MLTHQTGYIQMKRIKNDINSVYFELQISLSVADLSPASCVVVIPTGCLFVQARWEHLQTMSTLIDIKQAKYTHVGMGN